MGRRNPRPIPIGTSEIIDITLQELMALWEHLHKYVHPDKARGAGQGVYTENYARILKEVIKKSPSGATKDMSKLEAIVEDPAKRAAIGVLTEADHTERLPTYSKPSDLTPQEMEMLRNYYKLNTEGKILPEFFDKYRRSQEPGAHPVFARNEREMGQIPWEKPFSESVLGYNTDQREVRNIPDERLRGLGLDLSARTITGSPEALETTILPIEKIYLLDNTVTSSPFSPPFGVQWSVQWNPPMASWSRHWVWPEGPYRAGNPSDLTDKWNIQPFNFLQGGHLASGRHRGRAFTMWGPDWVKTRAGRADEIALKINAEFSPKWLFEIISQVFILFPKTTQIKIASNEAQSPDISWDAGENLANDPYLRGRKDVGWDSHWVLNPDSEKKNKEALIKLGKAAVKFEKHMDDQEWVRSQPGETWDTIMDRLRKRKQTHTGTLRFTMGAAEIGKLTFQEQFLLIFAQTFSVLAHEITHAVDPGIPARRKKIVGPEDWTGYLNQPHEVRASVQEMWKQVKFYILNESGETGESVAQTRNRLISENMKDFPGWVRKVSRRDRSVENDYTEKNRHRVLSTIYQMMKETK